MDGCSDTMKPTDSTQVPEGVHTALRGRPNTKNQRGAMGADAPGRDCKSRKIMVCDRMFTFPKTFRDDFRSLRARVGHRKQWVEGSRNSRVIRTLSESSRTIRLMP